MTACPHCKKAIGSVLIQPIDGFHGMTKYKCVSYNCPMCHASISIAMDPIALKADTVNAIKRK